MISPGTSVSEGQPVIELETDKAVVEVPSSVSGTVKDIRVKEGEKVKVGQVIFTVENGTGAKTAPSAEPPAKAEPVPAPPPAKAEAKPAAPAPAPAPAQTAAPASSSATGFTLPELGENVHQGDLVRLMVSP